MARISRKASNFVGLDVHAERISVAIAEQEGEVRSLGSIPNRPECISKLVNKLNASGPWKACYEAGPTGYTLYWQLTQKGIECEVIAPSLIPVKAGDRVKTDTRDAIKLAQCYRAGELTAVWVPDAAHEALRDLVRAREAAKRDELRARHRLGKYLLRYGKRPPEKVRSWTIKHLEWIKTKVVFEHEAQRWTLEDYLSEVDHCSLRIIKLDGLIDKAIEATPEKIKEVIMGLQALRGISKVSAVTIVAELGQISRFSGARQLMAYSGTVPGEHSSGGKTRRGGITKTGNSHLRRILIESAWSQRCKPVLSSLVRKRRENLPPEIQEIAAKAMNRLHSRYARLTARGKNRQQVITAVAREMLGFIWSIGVAIERKNAA